jgi:hypothetical protein
MVDILALALSHGLLALAAWRLLMRPDLDVESARGNASSPSDAAPAAGGKAPASRSRTAPVRREMRWPGGDDPREDGDA